MQKMAEFNTVHIVSLENASRFLSGAPVKIFHIPVKFFMTIAKIFHNSSKGQLRRFERQFVAVNHRIDRCELLEVVVLQIWR